MRYKISDWVVMHITIPILALKLYKDTFKEEIHETPHQPLSDRCATRA